MDRLCTALRGIISTAIISGLAALAPAGAARAEPDPFIAYGAQSTFSLATIAVAPARTMNIAAEFSALDLFARRPLKLDLTSVDPLELVAPPQHGPAEHQPAEPFGVNIAAINRGAIVGKWQAVKKRLARESKILERCRTDAATCPVAARSFLAIIDKAQADTGWLRIADINRAINLNIKPMSDMAQYGVADLWATPLMLFASHAGDCEDYAIAKYVALRKIGISDDDMRLVIGHDHATREDHALLAVRYERQWRILDNRTLAVRQDIAMAQLEPLFIIDRSGVKRTAPALPETVASTLKVRPAGLISVASTGSPVHSPLLAWLPPATP